MASELKVNKITPESGVTLTLGDSGDTINFGSGVLPNFENLTVTGDLTVDTNSLKVDSTNNRVGIGTASPSVALDVVGAITATGNITGTLATAAQPNITSLGTLTGLTTTGDINLGDNDKAVFGAGSDLQIYHNSANGKSYIEESGTGNLVIRGTDIDILSGDGEAMVTAIANGAVNLYYDNNKKFETTSTGIDVTGRVTSDALTVSGSASTVATLESSTTSVYQQLRNSASSGGYIGYSNDDLTLWANASYKGFLLDGATNDISFYEDTGTTPKFFWDASTEYLGLGTTSPDRAIKIHQDNAYVWIADAAGGNVGFIGGSGQNDGLMRLYEGGGHTARVEIHSDDVSYFNGGNVGIGTSSPSSELHIENTNEVDIKINATNIASNDQRIGQLGFWNNGDSVAVISSHRESASDDAYLKFSTQSTGGSVTERMRIDSSGSITKPNQPAFSAYASADQNNVATGHTNIENDTEVFDTQGNYNTGTYTFTAPVDGKYYFSASVNVINVPSNAQWITGQLVTSNGTKNFSRPIVWYDTASGDKQFSMPISGIFDLDANDTAYVRFYQFTGSTVTDIVANRSYAWFEGYLLG